MNCGDFRYLIQRRFDVELPPQDDRALLIHLETCDSCQKFYHQMQQVIIAAEELDLSEDLQPRQPEDLFNKILLSLPVEKSNLTSFIISFLQRFGFMNNREKINPQEENGLLPPSNRAVAQKQMVFNNNDDNFSKGESLLTTQAFSFSTTNQVIPSLSKETPTTKLPEGQNFATNTVADQTVTRSLGQKFGISAANTQLSNKQGLSLAESIKQKISEMSKSDIEYQTSVNSAEPVSEPMDEWTIPHSPQWPKLDTNANSTQWPNEIPGSRAPNTWGNTLSNWSNAELKENSAIHSLPAADNEDNLQAEQFVQLNDQATVMSVPKNNWDQQAEQLETGNWQTVQFDNVLGAANYSVIPPPSVIPSPSVDPLPKTFSIEPSAPPVAPLISQNVSSEIFVGQPNSQMTPAQTSAPEAGITPISEFLPRGKEIDFPIENFPQLFNQEPPASDSKNKQIIEDKKEYNLTEGSSNGGPRIYPVVSKRAQTNVPIFNNAAAENINNVKSENVKPEIERALTANININIPSDSNNTFKPSVSAQTNLKEPESEIFMPPSADIPTANSSVNEVEESHLFNFDDSAIDKIFSNNLGVHERVITAQKSNFSNSLDLSDKQNFSELTQHKELESLAIKASQQPQSNDAKDINPLTNSFNSDYLVPSVQSFLPDSQPSSANTPADVSSVIHKEANGLLAVDDNMIDRIFADTLGVPDHITKNLVGTSTSQKSIASVDQPIMPSDDTTILLNEPLSPQLNTPKPPSATEIKSASRSFGQTDPSNYSSGKQKIIGVGKLDGRTENLNDPSSGRIASIGKFLLDNKDLEKIGKITALDLSDSKMRTLTIEANEELKNLLKQIDAQEGVIGTIIVGHDGLLIANTMPQEMDPESLGVWALGVFMGTAHVVEKLGDDNVRQIVSQTNQGYLIIANFGAGLLVNLTSPIMLDRLLPLMRTITQLVAA